MTDNALATIDGRGGLAEVPRPVSWMEVEAEVRKLYAPHCTDTEWEVFKAEASALGLDPRKREFIAMPIGSEKVLDDRGRPVRGPDNKDVWRKTYSGYITIHGARTIASRQGMLDSSETHWCAEDGVWKDVWLSDDPPAGCKVTVYLRGNAGRGFSGVATKRDFRTRMVWTGEGRDRKQVPELIPIWAERPEVMLEVRAEMRALRKAGLLGDMPFLERGLVTIGEDGEALLHAGDRAERLQAGRKVHAIASGRGVDHDGVRSVLQDIDPEVSSVAEAPIEDLAAAGDLLDVLDADGVEVLSGTPEEEVQGEAYEPAPAPSPVPADGKMTKEQSRWIWEHGRRLPTGTLTKREENVLLDDGSLTVTYAEADKLIAKIARLEAEREQEPTETAYDEDGIERPIADSPSHTEAQDDDWTAFWKEAKAAGFKDGPALTSAAGVAGLPGDLKQARTILRQAIAKAKKG